MKVCCLYNPYAKFFYNEFVEQVKLLFLNGTGQRFICVTIKTTVQVESMFSYKEPYIESSVSM